MRGVDVEGVADVLDQERWVDGVIPNPDRIAGDPAFWEGDEFGAVFGGFFNVFDGFLDGGFEIEPAVRII